MNADVVSLSVVFTLYLLFFAWLVWSHPAPRQPEQVWSDDILECDGEPLLTDPIDLELQRILDGGR